MKKEWQMYKNQKAIEGVPEKQNVQQLAERF
jgi:hypothetical protein